MVHVWVRAYVLWLVGIGAVLKQQFHHGSVPLQESEHEWLPPRATRKIVASGSEVNLSVSPSAGTGSRVYSLSAFAQRKGEWSTIFHVDKAPTLHLFGN